MNLTFDQWVFACCIVAALIVTGGPWLVEQLSRAHFREKEKHIKRLLEMAENKERHET